MPMSHLELRLTTQQKYKNRRLFFKIVKNDKEVQKEGKNDAQTPRITSKIVCFLKHLFSIFHTCSFINQQPRL